MTANQLNNQQLAASCKALEPVKHEAGVQARLVIWTLGRLFHLAKVAANPASLQSKAANMGYRGWVGGSAKD